MSKDMVRADLGWDSDSTVYPGRADEDAANCLSKRDVDKIDKTQAVIL